MKRRAFLTLMGIAPIAAKAAVDAPGPDVDRYYEAGAPVDIEARWQTPTIQTIFKSDFGDIEVREAQRAYSAYMRAVVDRLQ